MKFLLSSLQLASLCALSSWSVSSQLVVTQSEDVTVEEGHTANISCCWTEGNEQTRVIWKTVKSVVKNEINKNKCSFLIITNMTEDHKGTYFCEVKVEIPFLITVSGNGTVLTVKSKLNETTKKNEDDSDSGTPKSLFLLIGLAVVAPVLLVTLICVCCKRRRQVQAARVIYEVPHFDSETQEMDKHSTGSGGSSQWCQVPVYESFDYFEQTEAKKAG